VLCVCAGLRGRLISTLQQDRSADFALNIVLLLENRPSECGSSSQV